MASYRDLDPTTFARNFKPMSKTLCARCHEEEQAGSACTDCHNYHIGRFPAALAAAPLALSGIAEETPAHNTKAILRLEEPQFPPSAR
jgi:hypothetical protein